MSASPIKSQSILRVVLINLLVIAVIIELFAVAYFFFARDYFFYTQISDSPSHQHISEEKNSSRRNAMPHVIHPILGTSRRPGIAVDEKVGVRRLKGLFEDEQLDQVASLTANNLGFFSPVDYPYIDDDDEFVVGIFGGSVAQWFALQGKDYLALRLKERFSALAGKDIVTLNMAQGGYKQPQQLILMNYLLAIGQNFDLIVNIDGFNEVALAASNREKNVYVGFPSAHTLLPLVDLSNEQSIDQDQLLLLAQSLSLKNEIQLLEIERAKSVFASFAAVKSLYSNALQQRYQDVIHELDDLQKNQNKESVIYVQPADGRNTDRSNLDLWQRSVSQMHALSSQLQIPFISITQPNQYYTNHVFSKAEEKVALAAGSSYQFEIDSHYPELEKMTVRMKEQGIHIESAIPIFDSESRAVYTDSCCHYTPLGNEILAEFIAKSIRTISDPTSAAAADQ